jgi:3-hydroxyacyl-CoA dehydrogenase
MVGIDISMHTFPIMHDAYGERFPFPVLVEKLVKAGRLGIKAGKGIYSDGKVDDQFMSIVREVQRETGTISTSFSAERLILRQVNEAVYCLQEGIASAAEIDRAMVLGTGFPVNKEGVGGPLHWADERGLDEVLLSLEDLKNLVGVRFWPHHLLKDYVHAGYLGKKTNRGFFAY